ncbi:MAG: hypothetical protein U0271_29240 [Polyangiaceae bacterium]
MSRLRLTSLFALGAAGCLQGCSDDETEPPPTVCAASLESSSSADLALQGTGSCAARVELALRVATGDPSAPEWSAAADSPVAVEGSWTLDGVTARRDVTLHNNGSSPVTVVGLEWATAAPLGVSVDRFLHNGYQSWSYTGVESIGSGALTDELGTAPHGGEDGDVLKEHYGVAWWWTFVSDASSSGFVVGADGGTVLKTYIAVDAPSSPRVRIVMGMTGDRVILAPGESKALDGLVVTLGDVGEGLERWSERVSALHPNPSARRPALGGWGSWNLYYEDITAAALRDEATWATANLAPIGMTDFLLDDGYEPHWGQWQADPSFGAELDALATEQQAAGLAPAIWVAPFYVDTTDPDFAAHPDWFVRGDDGEPRLYTNFGPTYAALEVTVPEARDKAVSALRALADAGYSTLKIDFLFGGALEGARDGSVTSLEAYALWMAALREGLPDVHLVGCGAPILPSVGWVDSMRIGPDIAYSLLPENHWDFVASEARHTAFRAVTDRFWALDPDVVLLRGTEIDDVEAWTHVVSGALAGGNYLLGDGRQSTPLRTAMALDPEIVAMTRDGLSARPDGLGSVVDEFNAYSPVLVGGRPVAIPHVWRKTAKDGSRTWVALFGWDDGATLDLELPDSAEELAPPASDGDSVHRVAAPTGELTVEPHAVRLFAY